MTQRGASGASGAFALMTSGTAGMSMKWTSVLPPLECTLTRGPWGALRLALTTRFASSILSMASRLARLMISVCLASARSSAWVRRRSSCLPLARCCCPPPPACFCLSPSRRSRSSERSTDARMVEERRDPRCAPGPPPSPRLARAASWRSFFRAAASALRAALSAALAAPPSRKEGPAPALPLEAAPAVPALPLAAALARLAAGST
mmetsp:Transcript_13289/g.40076  ORF Transcript_13289/g.40076 Transcript_13289/m.40076 type:complete len:207 (+) Transcript_13289:197-817(+)